MLTDPQISSLLQELANQERVAERQRGPNGNDELRDEAEKKANDIRRDLLKKADASQIYLYIKATGLANSDLFRNIWQSKAPQAEVWESLHFTEEQAHYFDDWRQPTLPDLSTFPVGSFTIQFCFVLSKPYISKNDREFYILENPIQRELNFCFPMVRSTSWKGALRATLWQMDLPETALPVLRMFGNPKKEDQTYNAGRLQFYSSFFTTSSLEIINPHDRETKTGKNPILLETVPAGTKSTFSVLYFPFDRIGEDELETSQQALVDLIQLSKAVRSMLTQYGFGAKTSSGFGVAADALPNKQKGQFWIKCHLPDGRQPLIDQDFDSLGLMVRKAEALGRRLILTREKSS
jgi:CRISPR-associated protein Cmr2